MTNTNDPVSGASLQPERATVSDHPPASEAVAQLITATNREIADAHQHGRNAVTLRNVLIARLHFAIARRLARLAWKFAVMGKGRVS